MDKIMVGCEYSYFDGSSKLKPILCADTSGIACDSFIKDLGELLIKHGIKSIQGGAIDIIPAKYLYPDAENEVMAINLNSVKIVGSEEQLDGLGIITVTNETNIAGGITIERLLNTNKVVFPRYTLPRGDGISDDTISLQNSGIIKAQPSVGVQPIAYCFNSVTRIEGNVIVAPEIEDEWI